MRRKTGTHAAEATFRRIVYAFAPNYELRFKKPAAAGGLDCRVWPQGTYELRDKIGNLLIDPHGRIVYAPTQVKWLLVKEEFAPPTPVVEKRPPTVAEGDDLFRRRRPFKEPSPDADICSQCGAHIPADDFVTGWATYKLAIGSAHGKGVRIPYCHLHGTLRKGDYEEHLAASTRKEAA